jgi:hypothetical protein
MRRKLDLYERPWRRRRSPVETNGLRWRRKVWSAFVADLSATRSLRRVVTDHGHRFGLLFQLHLLHFL